MIVGVWSRGREVESVVGAKVDEDFVAAGAEPVLDAAASSFGRVRCTRIGALSGYAAYNKARGFGLEDADRLEEVRGFFTDAGTAPLIEVWAGDASEALGRRLAEAGFHAGEVGATLWTPLDGTTPDRPDADVEVRELAPGDDDAEYLDTLFAGYELSTTPQRTMMAIEHRSPHLRRYLARVDGRPAAAASLYIWGGRAYLAGAATVPAMRNHGCQGALIRRRLRDAAHAAGEAVVTSAFGSPSHANLERLGFRLAHTRTLWRPLRPARRDSRAT
jgi:hypothetical protein